MMHKLEIQSKKLILFLIYGLALFPILPRGIESVLMMLIFALTAFYYYKFDRIKATKKVVIKIAIFSSLFFLYVISLTYSVDLKSGLNYVIKVIPILIFPLIFGIFIPKLLTPKHIKNTLTIYVLAIFIGLCFIHIYLYLSTEIKSLSNWEFRNAFEALTDVHGTYFSIWIGFGLFIILFKLSALAKQQKYAVLVGWFFIAVYLLYWQLKLGARVPQIMTVILLSVGFFFLVKRKIYKGLGLLGLVVFVSVIFILKPNFTQRIKQLAAYDFSLPKGDYNFDYETITNEQIRNGIYYCSLKLVKKSWLIGYGIGDVNPKLQNCYNLELESNVYSMFSYNSHNQYLLLLLAVGIFGLLIFLVSLGLALYLSIKNENLLYLLFSLFILFTLLSENVLSRHDGILFYSFFNAIFAFTKTKREVFN